MTLSGEGYYFHTACVCVAFIMLMEVLAFSIYGLFQSETPPNARSRRVGGGNGSSDGGSSSHASDGDSEVDGRLAAVLQSRRSDFARHAAPPRRRVMSPSSSPPPPYSQVGYRASDNRLEFSHSATTAAPAVAAAAVSSAGDTLYVTVEDEGASAIGVQGSTTSSPASSLAYLDPAAVQAPTTPSPPPPPPSPNELQAGETSNVRRLTEFFNGRVSTSSGT